MESFEELLAAHGGAVERYIKFRLSSAADAEDLYQETCLTAYESFGQLKAPAAFKAWLLSIARNKCSDYFRAQARRLEIPLDDVLEPVLDYGRMGLTETLAVRDIVRRLGDKDKQILYLYFFCQLSQAEIARRLGIPTGTVKSRLYNAKQNFRALYPHSVKKPKGEIYMKKLPEYLPEYSIVPSNQEPFAVQWEELMGWPIVPRLGEKLSWGLYDMPSRHRTEYTDMEVTGRAEVHGIEGVEILAVQHDAENYYRTGSVNEIQRRFVAQLTDTHCRFLAECHPENGVQKLYTFLDGDSFMNNWGFGPDNRGKEIQMVPKGLLRRQGDEITGAVPSETLDVVGRYTVTINGKSYDTICIMDIEAFNDAVASEEYVDQNGRCILWRRFNRDDWALAHFSGRPWSEKLPENQRLRINGQTYVHWYDCVTDYIF